MPYIDEVEASKAPMCSRCGRMCEPAELEVCPICKRRFCGFCTYRVGSRSYCGRPCGDSYFFGGEVDEDGMSEE